MKKFVCIVLLLVVACEFWSAEALRCIPCVPENCPPPPKCLWGAGKDVCNCCAQCYKGPGEKCGGPWNIFGVCGERLKCNKNVPADAEEYAMFNAEGICIADQ